MRRNIVIVILCILMFIITLIEGCIDNIKENKVNNYYQRIKEVHLEEDDSFFKNWRYVLNLIDNVEEKQNINKLKDKMIEDLITNYNIESCEITNLSYINNIIRFDIQLDTKRIYVTIIKNKDNYNEYDYKYTVYDLE